MKIIYSYWSTANQFSASTSKELAALSNYQAQAQGYETILYTDKRGYDNLFKNIQFNDIKFLDQTVLDKFPSTGWSLGKLWTVANIDFPFLHLDLDLLLKKPISEKVLSYDNVFLHHEIWMDKILKNSAQMIKTKPSLLNELKNYRSYNCAIFGGTNYKLFNEVARNICEYAIDNAEFLEKLSLSQRDLKQRKIAQHYLYLPMVLEQLWMPHIMMNKGVKINIMLDNPELNEIHKQDFSDMSVNYTEESADIYTDIYKKLSINYYKLLSSQAAECGILHYYNNNKTIHRKSIIEHVKKLNLKF